MAEQNLSGKVIVITGASSGFGRGAALRFALEGVSLVLAARRGEVLDQLVQQCEAKGSRTIAVPTDVGQKGDVATLARQAISVFGRIDVWINNAGVGAIGKFWDIPLADHAKVIETNLLGVIYGSYFAIQQFRQQGSGTLINTASGLGKIPAALYSTYTASKYGVVGLSAALRQELAESELDDIHVCTVLPMAMDTPWFEHAANYTGHEVEPIAPVYDPQEVIDAYVRLATKPEAETVVGGGGRILEAVHNLVPGLVEGVLSKQIHSTEEKAPREAKSSKSLHKSSSDDASVYGKQAKNGKK